MNTNTTMYRSRPSRSVKGCPQPEPPEYRPIVYVPQLRLLPVPAANDDRPTPPGSAQAVAA
ncbi:MAG TPA: hypothetical protein VFP92_10670 [Rhodanobacteraceae bacterium]|nr:hypothetical protein [Rhodanobacteraceae bacterium]